MTPTSTDPVVTTTQPTGPTGPSGPAAVPVRSERGITTAEYAVGTAAGAGLAGLLYKLLTGGFGDQLLKTLFDHVLGLLGIG